MRTHSRRDFLKRAGAGALGAGLGWSGLARVLGQAASSPSRPNIVFILADDMGWGDLGCHGHPRIRTPNLDRLAAAGKLFTQFTVPSPVCSPTRAGILTGLFPARTAIHGHLATAKHNNERGMPNQLDPAYPTLPRALQKAGYYTGHIGKWHLGGQRGESPSPTAYGFDWQKSVLSADTGYAFDDSLRAHSTRLFVDDAIAFLRQHKDNPFFLNLWLLHPHATLDPTDEMMKPYAHLVDPKVADKHKGALQIYYGVITYMDQQIGRLLKELDDLGLAENTLVVFSSDNGPEDIHIVNATHSAAGSPGPFRGRKRSLYEGGIRVPFIARWPRRIQPGRVDDATVINAVDLYPTFCSIAGAQAAADIDGENMADALTGDRKPRTKPLMWQWRFPIAGYHIHRSPMLAIRDGDWKLLMNPDRSRVELYDLSKDPSETDNLAAQHGDVVARLAKPLLQWHRSLPDGPISPEAGSNRYPWPTPKSVGG